METTENPNGETITMAEFLEQEQELEEEYVAVLGASDEKCCTYEKGAVKRQALYSCLTCCPEARNDLKRCAGICLACSYSCHENHELIELYTKRNFRCDCPTERIDGNKCVFNAASSAVPKPRNADNLYNQNFKGLYCNCHRPYPDPEATSEELMFQCTVCEDWFHLEHLDAGPNAFKILKARVEVICDGCMKLHDFLCDYTGLAVKAFEDLDESVTNLDDVTVCDDDDNKLRSDLDKSISEIMNMGESDGTVKQPTETVDAVDAVDSEPMEKRQKLENEAEQSDSVQKIDEKKCRRPTNKSDYEKGATLWAFNWREALCRCVDCLELYRTQKVEFLIDAEDSVDLYSARGLKRAALQGTAYERGIRAFSSMGRVQQIDAITEYNLMKEKLKAYLHTFAVSNKVVTEEDINTFFAQINKEKSAKPEQPYFCR